VDDEALPSFQKRRSSFDLPVSRRRQRVANSETTNQGREHPADSVHGD
jgi:hypothetical protein